MAQIKFHKRQGDVLQSEATEILYGGAAGGGKSYLLRALAVALCYDCPGLQVYIFRRHYPDLISNHMTGHMSFHEMLAPMVETGQVKIVAEDIRFWNGSGIHLRHCQHETDVTKYQGAEIHVLLMDELTHFTEYQYRFLRSRVRLGGTVVPDQWKHKLPCIVTASNPGGLGHQWVKRAFIDMSEPYEAKRMIDDEGGMIRQYIPAKLADNPTLMQNDPQYFNRLSGLGSPELVKAMKDGDWDIVAGAAFEKLSREKHIIRPFAIPYWWTRFTCLDWGTAKPFSHGWYTVCDEDIVLKANGDWKERFIMKGSIIQYRELYGWNGNPDQGTREEARAVAKRIYDMEDKDEKIDYRIADSAMWAEHDGPSAAENMMKAFAALEAKAPAMEKSRKDRKANYLEFRNRLDAKDGEQPGFYIWPICQHFWRTVPELQLDQRDPEKGWDTNQEDHCADQSGYALASRPMVMDQRTYDDDLYDESRRKAFEAELGHKGGGRYS